MPKRDETDDLDRLIDVAVDTFFVEAPTSGELSVATDIASPGPSQPSAAGTASAPTSKSPSLDEAVDTLFMTAFKGTPSSITSGDQETDWAIDLAVETLFVEQPETPPPETAQLDVRVAESVSDAEQLVEYNEIPAPAPPRKEPTTKRSSPVPTSGTGVAPESAFTYEDAVAEEISRHMHTLLSETAQPGQTSAQEDARRFSGGSPPPGVSAACPGLVPASETPGDHSYVGMGNLKTICERVSQRTPKGAGPIPGQRDSRFRCAGNENCFGICSQAHVSGTPRVCPLSDGGYRLSGQEAVFF